MNIAIELTKIKHLASVFNREAVKWNIPIDILVSVAILENINRPYLFRIVENALFRFKIGNKPRTLGLMQVKVDKLISDEESIALAAKEFSSYNNLRSETIALKYNGSTEYAKCLEYVNALVKVSCHFDCFISNNSR